jgi:hypothetical protein
MLGQPEIVTNHRRVGSRQHGQRLIAGSRVRPGKQACLDFEPRDLVSAASERASSVWCSA